MDFLVLSAAREFAHQADQHKESISIIVRRIAIWRNNLFNNISAFRAVLEVEIRFSTALINAGRIF
jgi:hypothetical protein